MLKRNLLVVILILSGTFSLAKEIDTVDYVEGALYVKFSSGDISLPKNICNGQNREIDTYHLFSSLSGQTSRSGSAKENENRLLCTDLVSMIDRYGIHHRIFSLHVSKSESLNHAFHLEFDSIGKTESLIRELENHPLVEYVERVPLYKIEPVLGIPSDYLPEDTTLKSIEEKPDDPFYGEVGGVHTSWHLDMVGYQELYGKYQGDPKVKVAVIDNAVWAKHEDLQIDTNYIYDVYNHIYGEAMPPRYVSPNQIGTPEEPSSAYVWSHGTHCAGLIGAKTGNGVGIASLASGVTLMGARVSDNSGNNLTVAAKGVLWAVDKGARIVSMSYGSTAHSITESSIYSELVKKGIILIAAAGNKSSAKEEYPANYEGVISVGSVNSDGQRSSFSNHGNWIDLWAPGGYMVSGGIEDENNQIFSTTFCVTQYYWEKDEFSGKKYDAMVGTSMATPLVSSAAALLLSYYPTLNNYQLQDILQQSGSRSGRGYIYVPEAFHLLENGSAEKIRDLKATWNQDSRRISLTWNLPETPGVKYYEIYRNDQLLGTTAGLNYEKVQEDTSGYFGVRAVYSDVKSLIEYTRIRNSSVSSGNNSIQTTWIDVRLDRTQALLYLELEDGHEYSGGSNVEIFNILGTAIKKYVGKVNVLNISDLKPGVYIGRVYRSDGNLQIFRFVL